jgi:hypothetical protein
MMEEYEGVGGMRTVWGKRKYSDKTYHTDTLSTTNPT